MAVMAVMVVVVVWVRSRDSSEGGGAERRGEEKSEWGGEERERERGRCGQNFGFAGEPTLYLGTY